MSEQPLPEPLESFLQEPPKSAPPERLRRALWEETSARLRSPRRRWPWAIGAAAAMLLIASAYLSWPAPQAVREQLIVVRVPDGPAPSQAEPTQPLELEWTAFDAEDNRERVRLYFQAGDRYLDERQDFESALRCYHQGLHYCDARELEFDPNDNWLLMALKRDRRKEP